MVRIVIHGQGRDMWPRWVYQAKKRVVADHEGHDTGIDIPIASSSCLFKLFVSRGKVVLAGLKHTTNPLGVNHTSYLSH